MEHAEKTTGTVDEKKGGFILHDDSEKEVLFPVQCRHQLIQGTHVTETFLLFKGEIPCRDQIDGQKRKHPRNKSCQARGGGPRFGPKPKKQEPKRGTDRGQK